MIILLLDIYPEVSSELEVAHSLSIGQDMDMMGAHRRRSNTAQRLERMKKDRKNREKLKIIQWKDNKDSTQLTRMYICIDDV